MNKEIYCGGCGIHVLSESAQQAYEYGWTKLKGVTEGIEFDIDVCPMCTEKRKPFSIIQKHIRKNRKDIQKMMVDMRRGVMSSE